MPLMSEGKPGPSATKLRAIWRTQKRKQVELAARVAARAAAGRPAGLDALTLAILDDWLCGQSVPVGIPTAAWRAVCAELLALSPADPTDPNPEGDRP